MTSTAPTPMLIAASSEANSSDGIYRDVRATSRCFCDEASTPVMDLPTGGVNVLVAGIVTRGRLFPTVENLSS